MGHRHSDCSSPRVALAVRRGWRAPEVPELAQPPMRAAQAIRLGAAEVVLRGLARSVRPPAQVVQVVRVEMAIS